jgi:hypothetical protein
MGPYEYTYMPAVKVFLYTVAPPFSLQVRLTDEYLHVLEADVSPDLRITLFESSLFEVEPTILKNFLSRDHGTTALHDCSRQIPLLSDVLR